VSPQSKNDRISAHPGITPSGGEEGTLHTGAPLTQKNSQVFSIQEKISSPCPAGKNPLFLLMENNGKIPNYLMRTRYCQRNRYRIAGKHQWFDLSSFLKK
jgi:hypothetical protein